MEDIIRFELTGNFQYDVGFLGLKRVLDFFNLPYENDEFSLSLDRETWLNLGHYAYLYGYYYKGLDAFAKKIKAKKCSNRENEFIEIIRGGKNKSFSNFLNSLVDFFKDENDAVKSGIRTRGALYPALSVINVSHLNMLNPGGKKQKKKKFESDFYYKEIVNKFLLKGQVDTELSEQTCDFCYKYKGERLNRKNFLFAPAAMNLYWYEKPFIYICPYCQGLNIFASYGTFTTKTNEKYFIYSSNLSELERDNAVAIKSFEEYVLEYIKHTIKVQTEITDKLFIEMRFSGQEPDIRFLPLSSYLLQFFCENSDLLERLHDNDFTGKAKTVIMCAFKDTLMSIINGEDLTSKVHFIVNCLLKQLSGNKNIQGFYPKGVKAEMQHKIRLYLFLYLYVMLLMKAKKS